MRTLPYILIAILALSSTSGGVRADEFACNEAISTFNLQLSRHEEAFKKYSSCVNWSKGRDTCSHEFDELTESQHWFQMDVNGVNEWCGSY